MVRIPKGASIKIQATLPANGSSELHSYYLESDFRIKDITGQLDGARIEEVKLSEFKLNGKNLLPIALPMNAVKQLIPQLPKLAAGSEVSFKLVSTVNQIAHVKFDVIPGD